MIIGPCGITDAGEEGGRNGGKRWVDAESCGNRVHFWIQKIRMYCMYWWNGHGYRRIKGRWDALNEERDEWIEERSEKSLVMAKADMLT